MDGSIMRRREFVAGLAALPFAVRGAAAQQSGRVYRIAIPLAVGNLTPEIAAKDPDLFGPLIFLNTQEKMTVTLGLTYLQGRAGTGGGRWGVIMAGSLLGVIPMLLLYAFGQKYFVQGLARAGLKG